MYRIGFVFFNRKYNNQSFYLNIIQLYIEFGMFTIVCSQNVNKKSIDNKKIGGIIKSTKVKESQSQNEVIKKWV